MVLLYWDCGIVELRHPPDPSRSGFCPVRPIFFRAQEVPEREKRIRRCPKMAGNTR